MYGAKAIAIDLMLGSRPRHRELPRERYVPKYPAPHPPPTNEPAQLQPTGPIATADNAPTAAAVRQELSEDFMLQER